MTLREALASIPDPRGRNRQFPLSGLLALIPVALPCRVDSLRGVSRFARAHPHLLPLLGLRRAPGHYALTTLLQRLDPQALRVEVRRFPGARQVVRVEREVVHKGSGEVRRGERYGVTRLGPGEADAEVLAGLRAFLVHVRGVRQKKAALERFSFNPLEALRFLGWDTV